MSHLSQKWLLIRVILSVVLERKVRFIATVDVVLDEYNSCLPKNKWLGVKHVSIVFGQTYVKVVLLMISSISKQFPIHSKWLQKASDCKKQGGRGAPCPRPLLKLLVLCIDIWNVLRREAVSSRAKSKVLG